MFVDLGEVIISRDKLRTSRQYFFSGNLMEIELGIVCLKATCVTPADGLDLALYVNTRMVMDYFLKKRTQSGGENGTLQASSSGTDSKPNRQPILPMAEEDISQVVAEDTKHNPRTKMDEELLPEVVDLDQKPQSDTRVVSIE